MNKSIFKCSDIIMFVLYAFVFFVMFWILASMSIKAPLCAEDIMYSELKFRNNINELRESLFIGGYITYFVFYLPAKIFHKHLYDILWIWRSFQYLIIIGTVFLYSRFLNERFLRFFGFLFGFLIILFGLVLQEHLVTSSYVFNRYILALFIFLIFQISYFKNIIYFGGKNKKYNIISAISVILLSTSTEIFLTEILVQITIISIINIFVKRFKYSLILYSSIIFTIVINILFNKILSLKHAQIPFLLDVNGYLKDFWTYGILHISELILLLLIVFILSVYVFFKNKHDYIMPLYAISMVIANFSAVVSLVFFDWHYFFTDKVIIVYYLNFLIPIFVLISYIKKHGILNKITGIILTGGILICGFCFFQKNYAFCVEKYTWSNGINKLKRQMIYKYEKAIRYAYLKDKKPVIYLEYMLIDELTDFGSTKIYNAMMNLHENAKGKDETICFDTNNDDIPIIKSMNISYNFVFNKGFCITNNEFNMINTQKNKDKDLPFIGIKELEETNFSRLKKDEFILNNYI